MQSEHCPLISVIVPVYQVEEYIDQCITSIRNQTYTNLEIILVVDGSEDNCLQKCKSHANLDDRVQVVYKENGGAHSARQLGFSLSRGEYIGFVDGDDWIDPKMYEELYLRARSTDAKIVISGMYDNFEKEERIRTPFFDEGFYSGSDFAEKIEPYLMYTGSFFQRGVSDSLNDKLFLKSTLELYLMMPNASHRLLDDTMVTYPSILASKSVYITKSPYYHYRNRLSSTKHHPMNDAYYQLADSIDEWLDRCACASEESQIDLQISYMVLAFLMQKCPNFFDIYENERLKLYGGISPKSRVVIYGAGVAGINLKEYLETISDIQVVGWADRDYCSFPEEMGICSPEEILSIRYDYVLLAITKAEMVENARKGLKGIGVKEESIRWISPEILSNPRPILEKLKRVSKMR